MKKYGRILLVGCVSLNLWAITPSHGVEGLDIGLMIETRSQYFLNGDYLIQSEGTYKPSQTIDIIWRKQYMAPIARQISTCTENEKNLPKFQYLQASWDVLLDLACFSQMAEMGESDRIQPRLLSLLKSFEKWKETAKASPRYIPIIIDIYEKDTDQQKDRYFQLVEKAFYKRLSKL